MALRMLGEKACLATLNLSSFSREAKKNPKDESGCDECRSQEALRRPDGGAFVGRCPKAMLKEEGNLLRGGLVGQLIK